MWPGGAPAPLGTQTVKDSRPLRDKSYQSKMRQDVYNYLTSSGFDIAPGTLSSISGKDYKAIFETLVLTVDPFYPFVEGSRLEEEFVPALRALRYPFSQLIDQRWLAAVASPHSWPSLLGVLHWLVEVCKVRSPVPIVKIADFSRCGMTTCRAATQPFKIPPIFPTNSMTSSTTRPSHFNTAKRRMTSG